MHDFPCVLVQVSQRYRVVQIHQTCLYNKEKTTDSLMHYQDTPPYNRSKTIQYRFQKYHEQSQINLALFPETCILFFIISRKNTLKPPCMFETRNSILELLCEFYIFQNRVCRTNGKSLEKIIHTEQSKEPNNDLLVLEIRRQNISAKQGFQLDK